MNAFIEKQNLILIDDHKVFAQSLELILEKIYNVVLVTDNGQQALKYLGLTDQPSVHLILLDLEMPKMNGLELHSKIKKNYPNIKTVVLSSHNDFKKTNTLIKEGVSGFVLKSVGKSELLKAIEVVLKGQTYISPEVDEKFRRILLGGELTQPVLKGREREVLKLIALEYTTQEIANQMSLSKHTIESYRKNLMVKLNVKNMAGLTKWAIKFGLIPAPEIL